jgi:AbrB family looped-hinge helix DNA binding protein
VPLKTIRYGTLNTNESATFDAMSVTISVDGAGRLVLPVDVRRRLNLVAGSKLQLDVVAQRIELTPQADTLLPAALSNGRRLVLASNGKPSDAARALRNERDDRAADAT